MADERPWGEDTVALGGSSREPADTEEAIADPPAGEALREDAEWGEDTVTLGIGDPAERQVPPVPVSRRKPTRRPPPFAVFGIGAAIVLLIAVSLLGGGEEKAMPVAPTVEPRQVGQDRPPAMSMEVRVKRQAESRRRTERIARARRQARDRQQRARKAARSKARSDNDATQAPEYTLEAESEYVPEYTPEPAPESTPSPAPAPPPSAPTPPGVEFGM
jgi:hypothetical protein